MRHARRGYFADARTEPGGDLVAVVGRDLGDPHGRIPLAVAREIDQDIHTASLGASLSTFVSIMMLGIDLPPPMDHAM
jgi:hypothetical protein